MKKIKCITENVRTFLNWYGLDEKKVRVCLSLPDFAIMKCETRKERIKYQVNISLPYYVENPHDYDIQQDMNSF